MTLPRLAARAALLVAIMAVAPAAPRLGALQVTQDGGRTSDAAAAQRALVDRYCVTCHNDRSRGAGMPDLPLNRLDWTKLGDAPETWEKVVRKLRAGSMPPPGRPRPDQAGYGVLLSYIESELDRAAFSHPNPGRTEALHRLNRKEYQNAVRDLLAVNLDVSAVLPTDDASYGFDNIASSLRISQAALEQYMSAARRISRAAVGVAPPAPVAEDFRQPPDAGQYDRIEGLPFGTRGGMLVPYTFSQQGEYEIEVELMCDASDCDGAAGFPDTHQLEVSIDGTRAELFTLEPRQEARPKEERLFRARVDVEAGPHDVAVAFLASSHAVEADQRVARSVRPYFGYGSTGLRAYQPFVQRVTIKGPFSPQGPGTTPSRQRVFVCQPAGPATQADCARRILAGLARQAYRRPVTDADVDELLKFFTPASAEGGFEHGIEMALRRLLVSPEFLFRVERDPAGVRPGVNYPISDLELASRLSFFIWSSLPDDRLLNAATAGRLHEPAALEAEVRRMLADDRSRALVESFASQWLELRNVEAASPSLPQYPEFNADLRKAFRRETELFVESVIREDRSALELLTADYTFLNERLAKHYGVPGVYGEQFRRVTLRDEHRRGLLGQGSILMVTSRPNRTSPVLRGKWILQNILGSPPPPPPANVPALPEPKVGSQIKAETMRDRMAAHRANPVCASCHAVIDPAGFALENFDAVGKWRDVDDAFNGVDVSGTLPDGSTFKNLTEFRAALLADPKRFVTALTEKLLTFALGRGLNQAHDMPTVRKIVRDAESNNYRFSDLVLGVAKSLPFQMRRSPDAAPSATVAGVTPTPADRREEAKKR